jgi:uncharacterized protein YbjT (DUF2867 family)
MKVLVLGATGGTGREICRVAAAKGHSVVALVRSAGRAQNLSGATLVDKDRQEDIVRISGLDWVLVRPMVLNDKPGTGAVQALTDLSDVHGGTIGRSDVARFVVDQLTDDQWLRRAPLIRG